MQSPPKNATTLAINNDKNANSYNFFRCKSHFFLLATLMTLSLMVTFHRFRQVERQLMAMASSASFEDYVKASYFATKEQQTPRRVRVIPLPNITFTNTSSAIQQQQLQQQRTMYKVHFLNRSHVARRDVFSASWLQSTADFMDMNLTRITFCEAAAFAAFARRTEKLRMTLDYLDLSIEHLSKWWKILYFQKNNVAYDSIIQRLTNYIQRYKDYPTPETPVFQNTLAMIAFMPYGRKDDERGYQLTVISLAATLESLRRAEMGRVVVVGLLEDDKIFVRAAFRFLADRVPLQHKFRKGRISKIGHMEVEFIQGSLDYGYTEFDPKNVPRATLFGVKEALNISLLEESERTESQTTYMKQWFGEDNEPGYWKYLYLTEPDSILQTRPNTLQQIRDEVDRGGIFAPHRLQPIPHESDLRGMSEKYYGLKESDGFDTIIELDAHGDGNHDVCCDEHAGKHFKPGLNSFVECEKGRWWACGFGRHRKGEDDPHVRLRPYQMMRLAQGVGLVTIAGTLHGRRCIAAKNSICEPPPWDGTVYDVGSLW